MYIVYAFFIHALSVVLGWFVAGCYGYHEGTPEYGNIMLAFILGGFVVIIAVLSAMYLHSGSTTRSDDEGYK
ncbi:hypothetical protein ACT414_18445 (plasmid) [Acinetobacter baumannii]